MREFLNDETLGILELDPDTGQPSQDANGSLIVKDPGKTDRVFVDVTMYNSQNSYVLGAVRFPGRYSYTGGDTVLDLLQYAGGLTPTADRPKIRLIRSFPKGSPARVLPVDYEEIAMGTDSSTNYAILPYDRLVIPCVLEGRRTTDAERHGSSGEGAGQDVRPMQASRPRGGSRALESPYFNRRLSDTPERPGTDLERRIEALEKKLDHLIDVVERTRTEPETGPARRAGGRRGMLRGEGELPGSMEPPPIRGTAGPDRRPGPQVPGPRRVGPTGPRPASIPDPKRNVPGGPTPSPFSTPLELPAERPSPLDEALPTPPPEH